MVDADIKRLTAQLDAAQSILDEIRVTCGCDAFGPPRDAAKDRITIALHTAERAYQNRRRRTEFIGTEALFGEPAWDMLLDLFIRQTNEEQITIKSACFHSDASATTVTRWVKVLEHNGLLTSHCDPDDSSRHLIHLTPAGYEGMLRYLESIAV